MKQKIFIPVCSKCKHWNGDNTCKAFEDGIPVDILAALNDHAEPTLDQMNEIVFESIDE